MLFICRCGQTHQWLVLTRLTTIYRLCPPTCSLLSTGLPGSDWCAIGWTWTPCCPLVSTHCTSWDSTTSAFSWMWWSWRMRCPSSSRVRIPERSCGSASTTRRRSICCSRGAKFGFGGGELQSCQSLNHCRHRLTYLPLDYFIPLNTCIQWPTEKQDIFFYIVKSRQFVCVGIPDHFLNPESRDWRCFNPGISGLWKTNKMPKFYMTFARKIPFLESWGPIPGSKAEKRTRPQHQVAYVIKVDIVLRSQSC